MKNPKEVLKNMPKEKLIAFLAISIASIAVILCIVLSLVGKSDTSKETESRETDKEIFISKYPSDSPLSLEFSSIGDGKCYVAGIGSFSGDELEIPEESPEGDMVVGIAPEAFWNCRELTMITIPANVLEIGARAFMGCRELVVINVSRDNSKYCSVGGILYTKDKTELVCCPAARVGNYYLLNLNVKKISDYAFYGITNLSEIRYEGSIKDFAEIDIGAGNEAFSSLPITCNYIPRK